jgi:hypothetical protein
VNELREDLDRALRALPVGEAPLERAKREGRRLRARRRVALLAGAVAIAAVAAGYPALARNTAAPGAPLTGTGTASPHTTPANGDPVITDGPAQPGAVAGDVAQGTIGDAWWQVTVRQPGAANSCVSFSLSTQGTSACTDVGLDLSQPGDLPADFTSVGNGSTEATAGQVANDVDYLVLTFTDGQQLKLIPATVGGYRWIAWAAPESMTIAHVVAHLGAANFDSGDTATAVPFDLPGQPPAFALWQVEGQAAAPRAEGTIGAGTEDGQVWSADAYEGPWGTCFVPAQDGPFCLPVQGLASTAVLGDWGGNAAGPSFGGAAPGVAFVKVRLSNGKSVEAKTAVVGNERLFAFWTGRGVTPRSWTAYSASGKQVGTGTVSAGSVIIQVSP